jgi:hypothetical protein
MTYADSSPDIIERIESFLAEDGRKALEINQVLINEYQADQGISVSPYCIQLGKLSDTIATRRWPCISTTSLHTLSWLPYSPRHPSLFIPRYTLSANDSGTRSNRSSRPTRSTPLTTSISINPLVEFICLAFTWNSREGSRRYQGYCRRGRKYGFGR